MLPLPTPMIRFCLILFSLLLPLSCAWADWNVVQIQGRRHVPIDDVSKFYRLNQRVEGGKSFTLTGSNRTVQGKAGAREVMINGVKYILCFPIVEQKGRILISAMDVTKIIEPVLRPSRINNATLVRTVVLDPGHGGHDAGAVGPFGREKDYTLDVAKRARALLQAAGYEVKMTRTGDVFIPLEERARFANRHRNAIFVSIHFNKSKSGAGTGIETFSLAPRGVPSMDEETVKVSHLKAHPGNARDAENIMLATSMHSALLRSLPLTDRGIKRARFVVIRDVTIPGVLLEGGFLNHPRDARVVASEAYRQRMAHCILQGVRNFAAAVNGTPQSMPPTLVVAAPEVEPAPKEEDAPVGSRTSRDRAVAQVKIDKPEEAASAQ